MTINELIPEIFEENDIDHSISINEYAVDIRIYNAYGLIEFAGKYPIFRDSRVNQLVYFINQVLKSIPNDDFLQYVDQPLNEKFKSVMQEKNILYSIEWKNIPEAWRNKNIFIRNYSNTKDLDEKDLENKEDLGSLFTYSICSFLGSDVSIKDFNNNGNFYSYCSAPENLENQEDPNPRPASELIEILPMATNTETFSQVKFNF
jgi:hypothetical protein